MKYDLYLLKRQEPTFLTKAGKRGYICPKCGNGSGDKGTGLERYISNKGEVKYKCFGSSCDFNGSIIDLYGECYGLDYESDNGKGEVIRQVAEYYGIAPMDQDSNETQRNATTYTPEPVKEKDYTDYYKWAEANNDYAYLLSRGIPEAIQKAFHVGYDPSWRSPRAIETVLARGGNPDNIPTTPRCIIPRSSGNYLARDTRNNLTEDQKSFEKQNEGNVALYNLRAMEDKAIICIVEGEIDCMSIYAAGHRAIALGGTGNVKMLLTYLKDNHKGQRFILMLDNDNPGRKAQAELAEGLKALEIDFVEAPYPEGVKDPNSYLQADRLGLALAIYSSQEELRKHEESELQNKHNAADLLDYFRTIEDQPYGFEALTGFEELDRIDRNFYGGLHEGLYIIGALSSLGKTTFCLQLADQIAKNGNDVIFFSLEQSKHELIAKSISRETFRLYGNRKDTSGKFIARETLQVLNNRRYRFYSQEEKKAIRDGIDSYSEYADHIYIYEGRYKGERLNVHAMKQIVKDHVETTKRSPVVFVDYLQIIAPADVRATDKQNTDYAVFELKELSRDFSIPVIAISSFNRENYNEPVSLTSFKESGAIEYSSDILLGLQWEGMDRLPGEKESERKKRLKLLETTNKSKKENKIPVPVELKCLKNRNGMTFTVCFDQVAAFNSYTIKKKNCFGAIGSGKNEVY